MHFSLLMVLFVSSISALASEDFDRQQIEQRIKPIGQVRQEEQKTSAPGITQVPEEAKTKTTEEEIPGKVVYDRSCSVCHRDGVAGAPKFRVAADWKVRLDAKKLDGLTVSAIKGMNAMPPKGTCMDCSDTDIKNAIEYMLPKT